MRERKRKLLSLVLILAMVLGMLPAWTLTASAAAENITENKNEGGISITEDTTFNIDEDATYTVESIRFDNDATLTVTGGGGLQVNGGITSYGFDINIILESSWLEAQSITAGNGFPGSNGSASNVNGGNGFNVSITANGNSVIYPQNISGGNGGIAASYEDMPGTPGQGGNVQINMNGGFFQAAAVSGGTGGDGNTKGDANLTITGGWLVADSINGGNGSTLGIDGGSVLIDDLNGIQPTSNGTDVYLTTVTVGTTSPDEIDVTYSVDGGSEISSSTDDYARLFLWLPTGEHRIEVEYNGKTYAGASVTTTNDGAATVTLSASALKVTNGTTTACYATWAEAVAAVEAGGTITLLDDVVLTSSDVFPSVACTIDGGTAKHVLTLSGKCNYLNADTTLKNLTLKNASNAIQFLYAYDASMSNGYHVTIQGTVTTTGNEIILGGKYVSSQLAVDGDLNCKSIQSFQQVKVGASGEVNVKTIMAIANMENSGSIALDIGVDIVYGTLSGSGNITFSKYCASGNLALENVSIAPDCSITLNAGYTPVAGQVLVRNEDSTIGVPNINQLKLGTGYNQFILSGAVNGSDYEYMLKSARTMTLADTTGTYTGNSIAIGDATVSPTIKSGETVVYTYYPTADDRTAGTNGTTAAPKNVGTYYIRATIAESSTCAAASADAILTINKEAGPPSPAEASVDDTANTFKFDALAGYTDLSLYEYSFDDGTTWTQVTANPILVGNIAGTVQVRLKETNNYAAGCVLTSSPFTATLEGSVGILGTAACEKLLTANVTGVQSNAVLSYQWKQTVGSTITNIGTGSTYKLGESDIGATITVTVTATDYTGSLTSAATATVTKAAAPAAVISYADETISFDSTTYEMNTAETFDGTAIVNGGSISNYTGQTLYLRVKAAHGGAPESAATAVIIPARVATAPTISSVSGSLVSSFTINATVAVTESGTCIYRVDNGAWQTSNLFNGLSLGTAHTFEAAYAATASTFQSAADSEAKTWETSNFSATDIAALITTITAPAKDATSLTLPVVPAGFTVAIKSVSPSAIVLATSGIITPPSVGTTVKVILTVKKTSDSTSTDTLEISVIIPAKTVDNSGSGSSSSGGSSSGGSSAQKTPKTATDTSTTTANATITVSTTATVKMGTDGTAEASVTKAQIDSAVTSAVEEAKKKDAGKTAVKIAVDTADRVAGISVTIPQAALNTIINSSGSELSISSPIVTVTFDETALAEIYQKASSDIKIQAASLDTTTLSDEGKAKIGDRPIYGLTVTSGNSTISSFGGGAATVSIPYTLATGEDGNKIVIYYISDSGELVMVPDCVYNAKTSMATFKTKHFSTYAVGYNNVSFSDVSGWSEGYINYLTAREIINGTGDGRFSPNVNITRAQFSAVLARLSGDDLGGYTSSAFSDVAVTDWYFAAVQWAHKNGIANGHDGKFNPNGIITREQMAVMQYNYAKYAGVYVSNAEGMAIREFSDYESISNWATPAISWAMKAGILAGNTDGSFAPANSSTRAVAAKMIALLQQGTVAKV